MTTEKTKALRRITSRRFVLSAGLLISFMSVTAFGAASLDSGFIHPPDTARPWVYWFWLNGNITSNGITADLAAMKRVGIGGALIMEVDQGAPAGPVGFMSPSWRALFRHVHVEARRLGLEINMNNDAGWNGSGGPWIQPEQSMQEVSWTETNVVGPRRFEGLLPTPKAVGGFYRDIAVQAFPKVDEYRLPGLETKADYQRRDLPKSSQPAPTSKSAIDPATLTNLTAQMDAKDRLLWEVPSGEWTIVRYGHTCTGVENAPAPLSGRGLECDKLSREGIEANFTGMMAKLVADTRATARRGPAGLVASHIDSWENGAQNWTARLREEFQKRRGYALTPFLPVFTGRLVTRPEVSERFLWDLRRTVSELVIENYAGHFHDLTKSTGLRFTVEAYGGPCDTLPYAGQSEEPMGEFWTPGGGAMETCRGMASAGHVYGKTIIGAEAFTSGDQERWREHPARLKALGDRAFCEGINRFVFHRYALQPWPNYQPGMTMGPWGQHYERTQTWWEWTRGWHEYLARCQFLLRQGRFVADLCYLQAEAPPQGFGQHPRAGYDWDECTDDAVLTRMAVRDHRIVLPDGMSYRLLVLSEARTMTPRLLRKIKELVDAGATILGPRPLTSPSLSDYPKCDEEIQRLGGELWGDCDGQRIKQHRFGRGHVVWGITPEAWLQQNGVPPDFTCGQPWRYIHRSTADAEIYFVANGQPFEATSTGSFRVSGKRPELWSPETGLTTPAAVYQEKAGLTHVAITLGPSASVFVVFRKSSKSDDPITSVRRDGQILLCAAPQPSPRIVVQQARYGVLDEPLRTRDVTRKVQSRIDAGDLSFTASVMADGDDPAVNIVKTLLVDYVIDGKLFTVKARDPETIHFGKEVVNVRVEKALYGVLEDPARTRDVRERLQRWLDAGESGFPVARLAEGDDPAFGVVKTLVADYTQEGKTRQIKGTDPEILHFAETTVPAGAAVQIICDGKGHPQLEAREPGVYETVSATGRIRRVNVAALPPPRELTGPWPVSFDPLWGGPAAIIFDQVQDWSQRPEDGIRYYSGPAIYRKTFSLNAALTNRNRLFLDLGKVAVMAEVTLNGRRLGTLWQPPFRLDISQAVKRGDNQLEVKVVNLWINRMIGDERLPEDSRRNADGTLQEWPDWVLAGKPSPAGRFTFASWRLWKRSDPLVESGLLGPVTLIATVRQPLE